MQPRSLSSNNRGYSRSDTPIATEADQLSGQDSPVRQAREGTAESIDLNSSSFGAGQRMRASKRQNLSGTPDQRSQSTFSVGKRGKQQHSASAEKLHARKNKERRGLPSRIIGREGQLARRVEHGRKSPSLRPQGNVEGNSITVAHTGMQKSGEGILRQERSPEGHSENPLLSEEPTNVTSQAQGAQTTGYEKYRLPKLAELEAKARDKRAKALEGRRAAEVFIKRAASEKMKGMKLALSKSTTLHDQADEFIEGVSKPTNIGGEKTVNSSKDEENDDSDQDTPSQDDSDSDHQSGTRSPSERSMATAPPSLQVAPSLQKPQVDRSEASITDPDAISTSDEDSTARSPVRQRSKTRSLVSGSSSVSADTSDSDANSVVHSTEATGEGGDTDQRSSGYSARDIAAGMPTTNITANTVSRHHQLPMTPPGTNSTDIEVTNSKHRHERRASNSPVQSPQSATDARRIPSAKSTRNTDQGKKLHTTDSKPERLRYPKLSQLMQVAKDSPPRNTSSRLTGGPNSKQPSADEDSENGDLDPDADESSESDEDGPGSNVLKGLRKRMTSLSGRPSQRC